MTSKFRDSTTPALNGNGNGAAPRSDANGDSADDAFGSVFARLADSVAIIGASRGAAASSDAWGEGPNRADIEDEEPEKEAQPLEEEGLDDPVRMYLREIGKVYLLSGADEKR